MPVDDIDQGAAKDQPHNAMTGSQDNDILGVDFHTDYQYAPTLEPGPSHVSRYHQVFNVEPQSESEPEEETELDEGTYVWFEPDIVPESEDTDEGDDEDDEIHATCFEDPRVAQVEESCTLDVQRQLDDLGSSVLSVVAKDNIKAMALKI